MVRILNNKSSKLYLLLALKPFTVTTELFYDIKTDMVKAWLGLGRGLAEFFYVYVVLARGMSEGETYRGQCPTPAVMMCPAKQAP